MQRQKKENRIRKAAREGCLITDKTLLVRLEANVSSETMEARDNGITFSKF